MRIILGLFLASATHLAAGVKGVGLADYLGALNACSMDSVAVNQATLNAKGSLKVNEPAFSNSLKKLKKSFKAFEAVKPSDPAFVGRHQEMLLHLQGGLAAFEALKTAAKAKDKEAMSHASARAMIHSRELLVAYRGFKKMIQSKIK